MISSSGLAIELHYCMGRLAEVELPGEEHERCSLCGMKDQAGCCHDELKFYKLEDSYKHIQNDISLSQPVKFIDKLDAFCQLSVLILSSEKSLSAYSNGPPGLTGKQRCDLFCIYRL
jgi:hypothetical protein